MISNILLPLEWKNVTALNLALKMVVEMNLLVFFGEEFGECGIAPTLTKIQTNLLKRANLSIRKLYGTFYEMCRRVE